MNKKIVSTSDCFRQEIYLDPIRFIFFNEFFRVAQKDKINITYSQSTGASCRLTIGIFDLQDAPCRSTIHNVSFCLSEPPQSSKKSLKNIKKLGPNIFSV